MHNTKTFQTTASQSKSSDSYCLQINKYLVDFQVVRDSRRRNENRVMKQDIIAKWNLNKSLCNHDTFMNIHKTAFSVLAVGVVPGVNGASGEQQKQTNLTRKAGGQINP